MKIFNTIGKLILETDSESLSGADLRGADLQYADLRGANLQYADLRDANLQYANLRGANLQYANLQYADLQYADFSGANFGGANFGGADLRGADLQYADLRGANFSGANFIVLKMNLWTAYITTNHIRIGCQSHDLSKWENFTDDEILCMHPEALDYWKKNKGIIISLCKRFNEKGE